MTCKLSDMTLANTARTINHKSACSYFYVFTTTTAAATTGPAGTYFTTTFTNDLALILIKKIKKTEMSRLTTISRIICIQCSPMAI